MPKILIEKIHAVCVLLLLSGCLLGSCHNAGANNNKAESHHSIDATGSLIEHMMVQSRVSSVPVNMNASIQDTAGVRTTLRQVVDSGGAIVYRVSDSYCMECVKAQFPYLKMISGKIGKKRVILLSSFYTFKAFKIFIQSNNLDLPAYQVNQNELSDMDIEGLYMPYFFKITPQKTTQYAFVPRKEMPELSAAYCQELIKTF